MQYLIKGKGRGLMNMKAHSKCLLIISVCLLIPFLGCHKKPPPPDFAKQPNCQHKRAQIGFFYNLNNSQTEILKVAPNTPAEKADLKPGDIIVSVNQLPVKTRSEYRAIMETITTETPISIVVKRNSEYITKTVIPKIVTSFYSASAIGRIVMEENKKVNLIIVPGEITYNYGGNISNSQLADWKKAMAVQSRDYVESGLVRAYRDQPNFSIVARENTDKILEELKIQQSGAVTELIKSGKIIGATHLLVIDFNRFRTPDWSTLDKTTRRLIEIETGKTIATESCDVIWW